MRSEKERRAARVSANSNNIRGQSDGRASMYCKGPEGRQPEFVQALDPIIGPSLGRTPRTPLRRAVAVPADHRTRDPRMRGAKPDRVWSGHRAVFSVTVCAA